MKLSKRKRSRSRRGAATIEMALVAPFVFFLIFSSIEFSRMMMVRQAMTNAVREGCRKAALVSTQDDATADAMVRQKLQGVVAYCQDEDIVRISFDPQFDSNSYLAPGSPITTEVEVDCDDVSIFPSFLFQGFSIKTTCTMYRE